MDIQKAIKEMWELACKYDEIPINALFVVFKDDNPYAKRLDTLIRLKNKALN